jgi:tRNA threonylcarbamoyladenosine biosynthesis protein TsaE
MEYISKSPSETYKIAEKFATGLKPGDVIALSGDLGSGKTTFVKGLAKALGIDKEITSPTFVILKKYLLPQNKRKIESMVHLDCYRLSSVVDAESIGLSEYLKSKKNITLIEWPENVDPVFADIKIRKISFQYIDEFTRKIKINK